MKKSFLLLVIVMWLISWITKADCINPDCTNWCNAQVINQHYTCLINEQQNRSITYLHEIWATKYNSLDTFRWQDYISRQEAAKFFSIAYKQLNKNNINTSCTLNDENNIDITLLEYVKDVCTKGIMKWSKNNFMWTSSLTIRQAFVMIYRMKIWIENENIKPWYKNYDFSKIPYLEGEIKSIAWWWESDIDKQQITRWQMADILYYALTK